MYPNLNLYDALISGKLVQGKYVLKSQLATHFTLIEFPFKLHQKVCMHNDIYFDSYYLIIS